MASWTIFWTFILTPHSTETSQVITMNVNERWQRDRFAEFGRNPPARGCSTPTWNMRILWLLPSGFYFLAHLEIIMAQRAQFGAGNSFSREVFLSNLTCWWSFCTQPSGIFASVVRSVSDQQTKCWVAKTVQDREMFLLNIYIKLGSPF